MASRTVSICDIGENEHNAERTTRFTVDGAHYEIDLCGAHGGEFTDALHRYTDVARRPSNGHGPKRKPNTDRERVATVRTWARSQGITIADRGRVPAQVVAAYNAGH